MGRIKKKIIIPIIGTIMAGMVFFVFTSIWAKTGNTGNKVLIPQHSLHKFTRPKHLSFTTGDSSTCIKLVNALELYHYSGRALDDAMSAKILARYLDMLDPTRNLFTQKDIKIFSKTKYSLDDTLKRGDLHPGYTMFNLFLQRSFDRLVYIKALLNKWKTEFNFYKKDRLYVDRESKPWPLTKKNLRILWRKELKNAILTLKLDKKSDKQITKDLKKRYKSRLNRLCQTNSADVFRTYMNAVTMSFDPHTTYFPPRYSEDFNIQMSLSLEGIGAVLQSEFGNTKVVSLVPAGPAEKSGKLMPGDRIIGVGQNTDGDIQDVVGWRIDDVVRLIRGPKGTVVRLQIIPAGKKGIQNSKIIAIRRDKVKLEEQAAHKKLVIIKENGHPYKIGIIDLPTFYLDFQALQAGKKNYRSTTRDVRLLIKGLKAKKINGLIIDLRDNGGGSLKEVNELIGLFIDSGPTVQIRARDGSISSLRDPDPAIVYKGPLIVITNRMSASASEIFAGAIKDYNRGIIVGSRTFGKGTVQALGPLSKGKLKITTAKFYRVSGKSTQDFGVLPDIKYPPTYNKKEIGESSLKDALAWDKTKPADYIPYRSLTPVIKKLKLYYDKQKIKDPGIRYLNEKYQLSSEIYRIKFWSLNENIRKRQKLNFEKKELKIENTFLKYTGHKPVKTIKEMNQRIKNELKSHAKGKKYGKDDILMNETEHIMADFIIIAKKQHYKW